MKHIVGCNYWGSKYGTDMWKYWDEDSVKKDIEELSKYGVTHLRVFPMWRDFQPIHAVRRWKGFIRDYSFENDVPINNEYGLDLACIDNFKTFCKICENNGVELIVAIVTGWMSGRLFVPPAVEGLNHFSDPESIMWQTKFIKGFVNNVKNEKCIIAWELGNECNNLSVCNSRRTAYVWSSIVRNAITAEDNTRPVMSGMHALNVYTDEIWTIQDQAEITDAVTPHPYPSPTVGGDVEPINRIRTSLIPTAHLALYSGVGKKPAILEETGTFNNIVGNEEATAQFAFVNMLSGLANGSMGYLWWCAHDQKLLKQPPYSWSMNENELGILKNGYEPKKIAFAMQKFAKAVASLPFDSLPNAETDAVCVIPDSLEKYHNITSAAYILAKQAGLNMTFRHFDDELPNAEVYIVPSMVGWSPISQDCYVKLREKARLGASVLFTTSNGFITEIENTVGLESLGMINDNNVRNANFGKHSLPFKYERKFMLKSVGAQVLCADTDGTVIFSKYKFGDGLIYFLNFPLESIVWETVNGFIDYPYYEIYKTVGENVLIKKPILSKNSNISVTLHKVTDQKYIAIAINYSEKDLKFDYEINGFKVSDIYYGSIETIPACDGVIFELESL